MGFKGLNFMEELQDYIAANSSLSLVVPGAGPNEGNFTIGEILDLDDLDKTFGTEIECSMYEEGGLITRTSKSANQERSVRFVYKGAYRQEAINKCWSLLQYLEDTKRISTQTFLILVARFSSMPRSFASDPAGTHLADFVATFIVRSHLS